MTILIATHLNSFDLDDLTEGEEPVYGSKRRERYRSTAIFWEIEDWSEHYSETLLFLYNYTNYPKYTSKRFFPFYYNLQSKIDSRKYSRFLNYRVFEKEKEFEKSFFPFFYWGEDRSELKTYFTFFPFFYTSSQNLKTNQNYEFLSPVLYYSNSEKLDEAQNLSASSEFILPVYRKFYEKEKDYEFTSYSIPALPLIYYSRENKTEFFTLGWIFGNEQKDSRLKKNYLFPFWYYSAEPQRKESFFISPIFYKDKTSYYDYKSYLYLLYTWEHGSRGWNFLGLAGSSIDENKFKKNYLFPIWYYKENEIFLSPLYSRVQSPEKTFYFGPLYYYANATDSKTIWVFNYYYSQNANLSYTNFFPFFEYETSPDVKSMSVFYIIQIQSSKTQFKLNLFPFYFYEKGLSGTNYSFLFGLYGLGYDEKEQLQTARFLPFYYYQKDNLLFTPFYARFGSEKGREGKIFSLVYNRVWDEENEFKNMLLYFNYKENRQENFFQTIAPIWWKWKQNKTEGSILFPIYGNYKNEIGEEFNLNILGIAQSTRTGIIRPEIDVGRKENRFYLDTDVSWFYALFRVSTRISAANPFLKVSEQTLLEKETLEEKPSLSKKKDFTRENTNFFYGYSALFSAIAYEKGDAKRHFRVFPLMWFTWDEENEDKLILFPPILPIAFYYNTPELKYLAFIPFYGEQLTPESKIQAVLLALYINESYKEKNLKETSILWPFFNFYHSEEESGFRVFPLFWKKFTQKENTFHFRNFSPLHYYSNYEDKTLSINQTQIISWLFYWKSKDTRDAKEKKYFFPIYYHSEYTLENLESDRYETNLISFSLLHYKRKEVSKFGKDGFIGDEVLFSPIFVNYKFYDKKEGSSWSLFPTFLFYTEDSLKEKYYNFALIANLSRKEKSTSAGVGFIQNFIGFEYRDDTKLMDSKFWIFPILYRYKEDYKKEAEDSYSLSSLNYFFPFIFHFKKDSYQKGNLTNSYFSLLTPLYLQQYYTFENQKESETKFYTIPFLYTSWNESEYSARLWLFISYNKELTSGEIELSIWPIYPIFYYDSKQKHTNILGVLFDTKQTGNYFRFYLFPVWYSSASYFSNLKDSSIYRRNSYFNIFPLYFSENLESFHKSSNREFSFFSLGFYYKKRNQSLYWNYLFLMDYESRDEDITKFGLLFHSLYFESSKDSLKTSIFYDWIWSSEKRADFTKYTFLFTKYQKEKDFLSMNFFPIYSYEETKNDLDFFFYPTLSSFEKNETKRKLSHLWGILYYNEENYSSKEMKNHSLLTFLHEYHEYSNPSGRVLEFTLLPLGALYSQKTIGETEFSRDVSVLWGSVFLYEKKLENDYHKYGSLWGFLWQYEYENRTDYKKFSILKLFSYETYKGVTRIMGIPIN